MSSFDDDLSYDFPTLSDPSGGTDSGVSYGPGDPFYDYDSYVNENYSNEGTKYADPNVLSTQGRGGSPVNASTAFKPEDFLKNLFKNLTGQGSKLAQGVENNPLGGLVGALLLSKLLSSKGRQTITGGYKGPGIDMTRTFTRTPRKIEYTPYSGQGFSGRSYFEPPAGKAAGGEITMSEGGTLEQGAFIIPADVVSHFGNGSSDAGMKLLSQGLGAIPIKGDGDGMSDSISATIEDGTPAAVAHDEMYVPREKVAAIGGGDLDKGIAQLERMMTAVRKARTGTDKQGKQIDPTKFMPGGAVQKYEGGTTVVGSNTGTGSTNSPSGGTTVEQNLASWAGPYVTNMLSNANALANAEYTPYTGQLTAGTSPLQQAGFSALGGYQAPDFSGAQSTLSGALSGLQGVSYAPTDISAQNVTAGSVAAPTNVTAQQATAATLGAAPTATAATLGAAPTATAAQMAGAPQVTAATLGAAPTATAQTGIASTLGAAPTTTAATLGAAPTTTAQTGVASLLGAAPTATASQMAAPSSIGYDKVSAPSVQTYQMGPVADIDIGSKGDITSRDIQAAQVGYRPDLETFQIADPEAIQTKSILDTDIGRYMSPYIQQVVNQQTQEAKRQSDIAQLAEQAKLTQAGAFGGSRGALMAAERGRNLADQLGGITATGYQSAFDRAQQQFNTEQQAALQAAQQNQQAKLTTAQQNLAAKLGVQQLGVNTDTQIALANMNAQQQAAVQNEANRLQATGMTAANALQQAVSNQQKNLTVGAQNLAAQQAAQQLGVQSGLQAGIANQQAGLQAGTTNAQLAQQANMTNAQLAQQVGLANQALAGQYGIANQQAQNQMGIANLQAQNQASLANQALAGQYGMTNAQLAQQANLANQALAGQYGIAQGQMDQQMGIANLQAQNQASLANQALAGQYGISGAQLAQQAALANQQAGLTTNQTNAQLAQQAALANQALAGQYGITGAQLQNAVALANQQTAAQYGLTGAQLQNAVAMQNAQLAQQAGIANQQAGLQAGTTNAQLAQQAAMQNAQLGLQAGQFNQQQALAGQQLGLQAAQAQAGLGQAQASIAAQQNAAQLAGINAQLTAGQQQWQQEQAGLDAMLKQYNQELMWPYQQLQFQQQMLAGLPVAAASTTANTSEYQDLANLLRELGIIGSTVTGG